MGTTICTGGISVAWSQAAKSRPSTGCSAEVPSDGDPRNPYGSVQVPDLPGRAREGAQLTPCRSAAGRM